MIFGKSHIADEFNKKVRSEIMSKIKSQNTRLELILENLLSRYSLIIVL